MSTLLTAHEISKAWPSHDLFRSIRFQLSEGDRVGLIGPNGAGKSTLLKILDGAEDPDDGEIIRRRGLRVAYVPQDDHFPDDATPRSAAIKAISLEEAQNMPIPVDDADMLSICNLFKESAGSPHISS